ncbi:MAG: LamB/YcsF family protein [Nocardioidaceae bacterium]
MRTIDLNADSGESFGRWQLGADDELAPLITSVNVACGWHAGDPATMARSIELAARHGVALGAHPGFPDLIGFGRRSIDYSPSEAAQAVLYQFGALKALADAQGVPVVHVKPHGSLYGLLGRDDDAADAVADAVAAADPSLLIVLEAGHTADRQRERGHRVVSEAFADLDYTDDGRIIIDPQSRPRDPRACAQQVADILAGRVSSVNGVETPIAAESICLHGDRPGAVDIARAVTDRIRSEGYEIRAIADPHREECT